jgi:dihydrofolate reductase
MLPKVAEGMNSKRKTVFSRTLDNRHRCKQTEESAPRRLGLLGSGSIVSQLTQAQLIDEYQIVLNPIVIGKGRSLFETFQNTVDLRANPNAILQEWQRSAIGTSQLDGRRERART